MKNLFKEKLSFKFGFVMVLSVSIIISLFTGFIIVKNIFLIEKELTKRLENTTNVAKTGLSSALWQFNSQYVHEFTDSLFLWDDVVYVKVLYNDKTISEKFRENYKNRNFQYFRSSDDFLVKDTQIFYQNHNVGRVQLAISKEIIKKALWETAKTTIILLFLVIVVILMATFFTIRNYLIKPVSRLEHLMQRVSLGESDIKFDTGKKDEIGRLSKKIDRMLRGMKKITASRDELNLEIMERKKIEKALRISEEKFREFVEGTDNLVTQIDKAGNYIYVNPVAEKVLGIPQKELKGKRALNFIHNDDIPEAKQWFKNNIDMKRNRAFIENRMINGVTGQVTYWLWTANFFYEKGEYSGVNCIGHDITKLKEAENERSRLEAQLRQAHKLEAVGTLAGGIAHDFNNILGIILGNAELAQQYFEMNSPRVSDKISEVITASQRAKDVVGQLLSFSRKNEIKKIPLKLDMLIKESVKLLRASIEASIKLELDISPNIKTINAEPTQIHQIIINLCTNSAHSMEKTGGKIVIALKNSEISLKKANYLGIPNGEYVELLVKDTGHGIPQEIKEKIFDPYFTTKETGKGSGMGLSVTHGIVKSHNGSISIKSSPGKGTSVIILFPIVDFEPENEKVYIQGTPEGRESILFVDDEESLVLIAKEFLKNLGYRVDACTNPLEALAHFKNTPDLYDLVVTDMTMPEMYGDILAMEILRIRKDIPIILCTGYSDKIDEVKAKDTGISVFLEKPVDNQYFARVIRNTLNKAQKKE